MHKIKLLIGILLLVALVCFVSEIAFAVGKQEEKIDYKTVGERDFSYASCVRKEFKVVIQEGITKEEIKKVAKIVYTQKKEAIPKLKEVQITFYYPDLNVNKDMANAVANWNIGSSGKWEIYCHSLRIKQPEMVDETDKSILKKDEFRKGIFITYDLVVSPSVSNKEAERTLKNKLNNLKEEWQDKVEWLGVDLFLGENYLPLMKGQWVSVKSTRPKKGINIKIDKDGRRQTKEQTKILSFEQMRRKVYYELAQCEHRAQEEADRLYPTNPMKSKHWQENVMKNVDKSDELTKKYKKKLFKKYGLVEKHLSKITVEGVRKGWPAP